MTQSPPTGDLVARLRAMNPWKDMDWPEVVKAAADRLGMIWTRETGKAKIPGDVIRWGKNGGDSWSFREALKQMQQIMNLSS